MSALGGIWNFDARPGAAEACRRILEAQRMYGPHGAGQWDDGAAALGRSLFELLPEDRCDRGPQVAGGGRFALVADVRLDNRDELAEALGLVAEEAGMLPDAAFILHAWERWQEGAFERLYGDYAFAFWDAADRKLVLARDATGMKPLHYHLGDGFFAFATMPKGLHAIPEIPIAPDEQRVAETLALLPELGPRSFFQGISRVESGHFVTVTRNGVAARRHWNPTPHSIGRWRGGDPVEAFRAELDRAVSVRLRGAERHVGAHLSAGLDSSAVAATAARLTAPTGGSVTAFTAVPRRGYDRSDRKGRIGNEGPIAAATASLYPNIEHVLIHSDGRSVTEGWDRTMALLDRPLFNPSNQVWWNAIAADAAQRGLEVMLTGAMGNLSVSFAGMELLPELVRSGSWLRLLEEARALVAAKQMRWPGVARAAFGPWLPKWLWIELTRMREGRSYRLSAYSALRADCADAVGLDRVASERAHDWSYRPRRDAFEARLWHLQRNDPGNFQKASLAQYGIDHRDPTADRRLIEFCLSLPSGEFLSNGQTRSMGRRALADRLPAETLAEPRRGYQAADWHEGLCAARTELADELARLSDVPQAERLLDLPRMRALLRDLPQDMWEETAMIERYRGALLRGSAAGRFLRWASRSNR